MKNRINYWTITSLVSKSPSISSPKRRKSKNNRKPRNGPRIWTRAMWIKSTGTNFYAITTSSMLRRKVAKWAKVRFLFPVELRFSEETRYSPVHVIFVHVIFLVFRNFYNGKLRV